MSNKNISDASNVAYLIKNSDLVNMNNRNTSDAAKLEKTKEILSTFPELYNELEKSIAQEKAEAQAEGYTEGYAQAIEDVKKNAEVVN